MAINDKLKKWFTTEDEEYDDDDYMEEDDFVPPVVARGNESEEELSERRSKNDMLMEALRGKGAQMILAEPKAYSEAQEIADHLLQKRGVIVNLQRIAPDQAKRIVDFLSGAVYTIAGDLQKIGPNIFLCAPNNFGVAGKISDDDSTKKVY
ncbi:cell division protein SepF [Culicoidibacter larvae]|uniref:Cell division protein SepF n=1 Tax=Culicoidibacter larvae TaxID=2579976 RepID=A0A5R8QF29_9FIRM|nr:cell division protein SepF [Culicoidibacter larvae]TLG76615.1 DUF552 domain-containing protein [Culicoidibacter larvae]